MRNIEAIDAWQLKSDEWSEVGRLTETLPAHITCEQNLRIAQNGVLHDAHLVLRVCRLG